jgi:predicted signal transduction protein with EAL and GGDEF domain
MILIEQVSASLTANDPELTDMIGVIASRLIEIIPDEETGAEMRKDGLLERALMYAAQVEQQIATQNERIEYLQGLSFTDELTGLINRRGFSEQLKRTLASARRFRHTGVLIYCDIDSFKDFNDIHGHCARDALPAPCRDCFRKIIARDRYGRTTGRRRIRHDRRPDTVE